MDKELVKKISEEISKFQIDIPYEEYIGHGELHSYKPSITAEQVAVIINKHCAEVIKPPFRVWAIFKHKGENHIVLEFKDGNALCARWLHIIDKTAVGNLAPKSEKHTLIIKTDDIKDILFVW